MAPSQADRAYELIRNDIIATELPPGQSGLMYSIGFVIATGCLHAVGIAIGLVHKWPAGRTALRFAGALVALAGFGFLWRAFA